MKSQKPNPVKPGKSTRVTFVTLIVSILVAACSYAYRAYAELKRHEASRPALRLATLVRDVRTFELSVGRVPKTFDEIEDRVWKHGTRPHFEEGGASFVLANYYYLYGAIDEHTAGVWAVPVGPRAEEAGSHFVVVTRNLVAHWQGPALEMKDLKNLPRNPAIAELAALGFTRRPDVDPRTERRRSVPLKTPSTRDVW